MNEEEIINKVEEIIEYSKLSTDIGFVDQTDKVNAIQGLLDLYNKEKEKNKKYENKIKDVLELIDTKPYTAYTLYGDILYNDENIRELLEERN